MRGQRWNLLLLWFSTRTLCWTGSHQDNWGIGSGRCPASPLPHRWLHRRWEVRLMAICLIQRWAFCSSTFSFPCENKCRTHRNGWWFTRESKIMTLPVLYLRRPLKSLFPTSCYCFWTQSTVDCQLRWWDLEVCLHKNGLLKYIKK